MNVCKRISHYWAISNRSRSKFIEKYSDWLNVVENIDVERIELHVSQKSDKVEPSTSSFRSLPNRFTKVPVKNKRCAIKINSFAKKAGTYAKSEF